MEFIDASSTERIGLNLIMQRLRPLSPYGKLMKAKMKVFTPGCDNQVQRQWQQVHALVTAWSQHRDEMQNIELILHTVQDIRGVVYKVASGYTLEDVDLYEVKRFLELTEQLGNQLDTLGWAYPSTLKMPGFTTLYNSLARGGDDTGFYLADDFAPGLAALRQGLRHMKIRLSQGRDKLKRQISREIGRGFNHWGRLRISKLEADLIEQLSANENLLLAAETYTEVEYVLRDTEELLSLAQQIMEYEDKLEAAEERIRRGLSQQVAQFQRSLLAACRRWGSWDLLLAKARLARETGYCIPLLVDDGDVHLEEFVNPVISGYLTEYDISFQPLSISIGSTPVTVITGANMGGKSVALKSVGLAVAMAQLGLLVPAKSASLSLRSFIYYSQQDEDPGQGLSTFGTEMHSLAAVLPQRDDWGLYLLDEPARGTNPWEGGALVRALVAWLGEGNSLTMVATHFPGLTGLKGVTHLQVAGLAGTDSEDLESLGAEGIKSLQKLMDYSLIPGKGGIPRDAIKVAGFLGLDPEILDRATQELEEMNQEV